MSEKVDELVSLSWDEVSKVHRSRNGIYQRNGQLISLLTDLGRLSKCYPDKESPDGKILFYTGSGRRGNQKLDVFNRSLIDAVRSGEVVPLFCKLRVNCWRHMGHWRVADSEYVDDQESQRRVWRFTLQKVVNEDLLVKKKK